MKHGADHNASIHEGGDDEDDHLAGASHLFFAPTFTDSCGNRACQFEKRTGLSIRLIQSYESSLPPLRRLVLAVLAAKPLQTRIALGKPVFEPKAPVFTFLNLLPQLGTRTAVPGSRRGVGWHMSNGCRPKAASSTQIHV